MLLVSKGEVKQGMSFAMAYTDLCSGRIEEEEKGVHGWVGRKIEGERGGLRRAREALSIT